MQTQEQEGYGTQYEVQDFSLPSTSRREEQQQQQHIQVKTAEVSSWHPGRTCRGLQAEAHFRAFKSVRSRPCTHR